MAVYIASEKSLLSLEEKTDNLIKGYKQCEAVENAVALHNSGLYVAQHKKPLIHKYARKETPVAKYVVPQKPTALAISKDGLWLAAGSDTGTLFLWALDSGVLKLVVEVHFQKITCLQFTEDSKALVSASADARILVWRVSDFVEARAQAPTPAHVLSGQTKQITQIVVGKGVWREARVFAASGDTTVCVYDLASGQLLHRFVLDTAVHTIAVDPIERAIYAGVEKGVCVLELYKINPYTKRLEALGGGGEPISTQDATYFETEEPVSALCLSLDASLLYIGDISGQVSAWDVGSGQLLRKTKKVVGPVKWLWCDEQIQECSPTSALSRKESDNLGPVVMAGSTYVIPVAFNLSTEIQESCTLRPQELSTSESANDQVHHLQQTVSQLKAQLDQASQRYDTLWQEFTKLQNKIS